MKKSDQLLRLNILSYKDSKYPRELEIIENLESNHDSDITKVMDAQDNSVGPK